MGQLATQAQNRQLAQMTPQQNMRKLLDRSWDRIKAVMPKEMNPQRLYQMYISTINREPALAGLHRGIGAVLLHALHVTGLGAQQRERARHGVHPPVRQQELPHRAEGATFILGYRGIIDLARRFRPAARHQRPAPCMRRRIRLRLRSGRTPQPRAVREARQAHPRVHGRQLQGRRPLHAGHGNRRDQRGHEAQPLRTQADQPMAHRFRGDGQEDRHPPSGPVPAMSVETKEQSPTTTAPPTTPTCSTPSSCLEGTRNTRTVRTPST